MKAEYNNVSHSRRGALWRRVHAGEPAGDVLSRGRIGRLWENKAARSAFPALSMRNPFAFGRLRLLRPGVFGLLRQRGFSLSPERYLRRPLSSPLQITLTRNGASAIHYGGSLPRPLSVVNHNTSHHKTSRYRQINQQFTRQWHDYRQLNVISHIGLAAPVLHGTAALRFRQVQRALLRLTGHAQTASGIFTVHTGRIWTDGDMPVVTGLAPSVTGFATVARFITRTLYNDISDIGRMRLPSLSPPTGTPSGAGMTGRDSLQATLVAFASAQHDTPGNSHAVSQGLTGLPVFQAINRGLRRQAIRRTSPLLRLTKLSLPVPLLARVSRMRRRGERRRPDGLDDVGNNPSWLSLFAELSPLYSQPFHPQPLSRQPALTAFQATSSDAAAVLPQRALRGITRRPSLLLNRDTLPGTRSGFILAARDSAGLRGLVVAMRGLGRNTVTSRGIAPYRNPARALSPRGQSSAALSEHDQFIRRQQMRAQYAIAELSRRQEQQRQDVQRRDERIFTELRQQLQTLQRSNSNEQAALLKAVQSLERALTQTLKTTPASALRPLSFMGNR